MSTSVKTTRQVLAELAVPYWTLYAAMRAGYISHPAARVGTSYVWTDSEVHAARRYFDGRRGAKD